MQIHFISIFNKK